MTPAGRRTAVRVYAPRPGRSVRPPDRDHPGPQVRGAGTPAGGPGLLRRLLELPLLALVALALAFAIKTLLVQAFYIPSASMTDTLAVNDRVLVEKLTYRFREPARGEVIVFRRPGLEQPERGFGDVVRSFLEGLGVVPPAADIDLIKRVVGLPGETITITGGTVHVDGVPIAEPYARLDGRDFEPVEVPDGHYFMLGDNRGDSDDSRSTLGTVAREGVVGRAFAILWPPGRATIGLAHDYPELDAARGVLQAAPRLRGHPSAVLSSLGGASGASSHVPERPTPTRTPEAEP